MVTIFTKTRAYYPKNIADHDCYVCGYKGGLLCLLFEVDYVHEGLRECHRPCEGRCEERMHDFTAKEREFFLNDIYYLQKQEAQ